MSDGHPPASPARRFSDGISLPELVHYLREGVYIMNSSGEVLDANPVAQGLLGVLELASGAPARVHDQSRTPGQWQTELAALARDGVVREFSRELVQPDGSTRSVLDTCYARTDDGVVTYHGVLVDVSVEARRGTGGVRDAHDRDAETGAYTAEYLDTLHSGSAVGPGVCVLRVAVDVAPVVARGTGSAMERLTRFLWRHVRATEAVVRTAPDQLVVVLPGADAAATEIVGRRLQLVALRSALAPFTLGWASRAVGESVPAAVQRATDSAVPVRVVERRYEAKALG